VKVAVIDDERDMRLSISQWLSLSGYEPESFASAEDALASINSNYPGVVISDIKMPGMDGITLLKKLMGQDNLLPVILITGHGDIPMAVEAMQLGAFNFLEKPFEPEDLTQLIKLAAQKRRLTLENRELRQELSDSSKIIKKLAGSSKVLLKLKEDILDFSQSDASVLVEGETGSGKTLVAHALHAVSQKVAKALITVHCSAYDEPTLSRRLFGPTEKTDSFLPAFEEAKGGTLILEDIERLPIDIQGKLLDKLVTLEKSSDIRLITVSNHSSPTFTKKILREDLYFRLSSLKISVPSLRKRGNDIIDLFSQYSLSFAEEYGCLPPVLTQEQSSQLMQAPWPGNVRQLINIAEQTIIQLRRGEFNLSSLLMFSEENMNNTITSDGKPLKLYVEAFEKSLIENSMRRHKGSINKVMEELLIPRRTLNEKMAKYSLNRSNFIE
jgi:DNA-binding NtrC family response regulator